MKKILLAFFSFTTVFASGQNFSSPYRLSLAVDVPLSANSVALLATGYIVGKSTALPPQQSLVALHRSSINVFDRGATRQNSAIARYSSDACLYASVALPLVHLASKNSRKDFGKIAAMSGEVFALNLALTEIVKETVRRKRPLMYNTDIPLDKKYKADNFKSFFSGHTSTVASMSFFFATTFATYNPGSKLKPMVWSLCAAFPVVTGFLRFKAGKHYWTDIITGYAIGALCGLAVPYLHSVKLKYNNK